MTRARWMVFSLALGAMCVPLPGCDALQSLMGGKAQPVPGDLAGWYTIARGQNPGGGSYGGEVHVTRRGEVWDVEWHLANDPAYTGVGVRHGDMLGIGWGLGAEYGVAVYDIEGTTLNGTWSVKGADAAGTEILEGPDSLDGEFKIVTSTLPGKDKGYTGTVTIKPHGEVYDVTWKLPSTSYTGVGIKHGERLVVGWGTTGKPAGVVLYDKHETRLDGLWSVPGATQMGSESLEPR